MCFLVMTTLSSCAYADLAGPAPYALLLDADTGATLYEKNADASMVPSSMLKLMTAFLVFKRLKAGTLSLQDTLPVSKKAVGVEGVKMLLKAGDHVAVEDLLRGIIVQSGNDACVVIAEGLSGSEAKFAQEMNKEAKRLGMTKSHFMNANGLPHPKNKTSCRDLSKLALAVLQNFPEYYSIFGEKEFTYAKVKQVNRNPLLYKFSGGDGIKTGYTDAGGKGLVGSAIRDGRRLIVVVNGLKTYDERGRVAKKILNWGFKNTKASA